MHRVRQGISQEKLAVDARIDRSYLGGLERQQENPTVDLLDRVAAALSITITELFTQARSGEPTPRPLKSGRRPIR
jgi:transcriptional regulator with XRE-family HTH domain